MKEIEHDTIITAGVAEVAIDIENDGTDTDTQKYLNLGRAATIIELSFNLAGSIKKFNGVTLKKPIPVATDGGRIFRPRFEEKGVMKYSSVTITTSGAAEVEITVI